MYRERYRYNGLIWTGVIAGCLVFWWLVIYGVWCLVKG